MVFTLSMVNVSSNGQNNAHGHTLTLTHSLKVTSECRKIRYVIHSHKFQLQCMSSSPFHSIRLVSVAFTEAAIKNAQKRRNVYFHVHIIISIYSVEQLVVRPNRRKQRRTHLTRDQPKNENHSNNKHNNISTQAEEGHVCNYQVRTATVNILTIHARCAFPRYKLVPILCAQTNDV